MRGWHDCLHHPPADYERWIMDDIPNALMQLVRTVTRDSTRFVV